MVGSHRLGVSPARRRHHSQAPAAMAPALQARPVVPRVRLTASTERKRAVTRHHEGRASTATMATLATNERATLHAMSSEYTHGLAAMLTRADPPRMAAKTIA